MHAPAVILPIFAKKGLMIKSMTGFGKATQNLAGRKVDVEIRSLNSKAADISVKLPLNYKDREMDIRALLSEKLERGKIDAFITLEVAASMEIVLNEELARGYYRELQKLARITGQENSDFTGILSRMPDIMKAEAAIPDPQEWETVEALIREAIQHLDQFRMEEGRSLETEILTRNQYILDYLLQVEQLENTRLGLKKEKLQKQLSELATPYDPGRFEQEMIFYLEKYDFTEEKLRLRKHIEFFVSTVEEAAGQGRKLGFIIQEMGREINTLGSKANDADIQRLVVLMKDELEKLKEQMANIL